MAFPWKLYGGALRPDAISGLTPAFSQALERLYAAAPPEVQAELGLNSAYRSMARQKELWDASNKSGRTVAEPGKSRHNHGDAVDLYGFGLGGGKTGLVSQATRDWVKANAASQGFYFPMAYEPWHMQMRAPEQGSAAGAAGEQFGPAMPKHREDYTPEQRRAAVASIESAGSGDYGALGPWTGDPQDGRDRAYGRYQMMGKNIPVWSKQVLGRTVTTDEFMRDPKLQDAIFDKIFGDYVQKYGEAGAASMWFSGTPDAQQDTKDKLGTTVRSYANRYLDALGKPLAEGAAYPEQPQQPGGGAGGAGTAVAGGPSPATGAPPKNPWEQRFEDFAGSLGTMAGAGAGKMPIARAAPPTATTTFSEPTQIVNPATVDAQRQQLAMALQRLNSGKLFNG